ncbi:hypothetical protein QUB60_26990 [Microcoleus sp. A2-C5]|uniref:hypothetical protein n=1 Tax=unclassified Microcoleus TaxID=2642155 RepID=UPI002FD4B686
MTYKEGRRKKEEGRRKKEEGRRRKKESTVRASVIKNFLNVLRTHILLTNDS